MNVKSSDKMTLTVANFMNADKAIPNDGDFHQFGFVTCPVGQVWDLGYGANLGQQNSLGRIYFDPQTATEAVEGELRIYRYDSNGMPVGLVFSGHTAELRATLADRTTQRVFEKRNLMIKEDSQYRIFFKSDATASKTLDKTKTKLYIDGMRYMI